MTSRFHANPLSDARRGFTLVELLVVITIIGILAGLALVALSGVPGAVQDTAVKMELTQIATALDLYKQTRESYPPDGSSTAAVNRHLRILFGQRSTTDRPQDVDSTTLTELINSGYLSPNATTALTTFDNLDPSETYVLFLMGFSPDVERPLTGKGERTPLFEFDETRLVDPDGDGWWSYKPKYNDSEIVYFNAKTYVDSSGNVATHIGDIASGTARPYGTANASSAFKWVNDNTFQLISAGRDGDFGSFDDNSTPRKVKVYPSGLASSISPVPSTVTPIDYTLEDLDNITNFTEGSTLEADEDLE